MDGIATENMFSDLDRQFARFIMQLSGGSDEELMLAALLVSSRTGSGDICLDIPSIAGTVLADSYEETDSAANLPDEQRWLSQLKKSPVVGRPGEFKPLILDDNGRLYLYRYWEYEQLLVENINKRLSTEPYSIDRELLQEGCKRLFPKSGGSGTDWQSIAALAAVIRWFCVISGGPGTGKTSTVAKILVLLIEQFLKQGHTPGIALAAPTGKAAARLKELIRQARDSLDCSDEVKHCIPEETYTIHRLLGYRHGSPFYYYTAENQLPYTVVIIDESSMADLALMSKLFQAVPLRAHLILLGDRDQLSSVEAGAVLGDICDTGREHGHSAHFADTIKELSDAVIETSAIDPPISDSIISLKKNYRFSSQSGIGAVSQAVRTGDADNAIELLQKNIFKDILFRDCLSGISLLAALKEPVVEGYSPYLRTADPAMALNLLSDFTILCPLRKGPFGVATVNLVVERILTDKGLIMPDSRWYRGRPVMITSNDYTQHLFNGDVGICLPADSGNDGLRTYFSASDAAIKKVLPLKLPVHETVFAMTVHKSQGSEFDHVIIVLPDKPSPVLTRELIYTAITRARSKVEIWGTEHILRYAINNPVKRTSGLRDALWGV